MEEEKGVMIRTIVKQSVYDRLLSFAKKYSTGRGDWDFGVGIEVLLDCYEESRLSVIGEKIDYLISTTSTEEEPKDKEKKDFQLLGGKTIPKDGE